MSEKTRDRIAWGGLGAVCALMYTFAWYALALMR